MSAIVNYTDVVTLKAVYEYLRFDEQDVSLQNELTQMVNAACRLIETYTSHRMKPQNIEYYYSENGILDVYDWPITAILAPTELEDMPSVQTKTLYTKFCTGNPAVGLTLAVGYADSCDVDPLLIQAVLETVRVWFYSAESDSQKGVLPEAALQMVNPIKRFVF